MRPQYAGPHPEVPREIRGLDHLIHPLKVWPTADKKKGREKYLLAMSNL
jgi:hypothetical protein